MKTSCTETRETGFEAIPGVEVCAYSQQTFKKKLIGHTAVKTCVVVRSVARAHVENQVSEQVPSTFHDTSYTVGISVDIFPPASRYFPNHASTSIAVCR